MMAINRICIVLAVTSCVLVLGANAATYKWVDEHGVTQYGDKPPPGLKSQQVQVRTPPSSGAPASKEKDTPATRLQEQEREFQQRRIERLEKEKAEEEKQARARAEAQQVKERCIVARNNLERLEKDSPVYRLDEKGARQYIDDKTRAAEVLSAKKEISTNCKS